MLVQDPPACLVSVHNEWDPLEEIIVGVADHARVPLPGPDLFAVEHHASARAASSRKATA